MKWNRIFICSALSIIFLATKHTAYGVVSKKQLPLSEKDVLKEVLSSGLFIQKVKIEKQKNLSQLLEKKYSFSSWGAFSNWTHSKRTNPQIFVFESKEDKSRSWTLGLEKKIPYGLSLKSVYSDLSEAQINSDFLNSAKSPEQIYRKNFSLEWSLNLTSALAQHWTLQAIQHGQNANEWLYYERAEELALKAASQYWKTYLTWMTYTQSKEGLKTYRRLVRQINNKKKYDFLNPGERPQILAEYENLKQAVDKQEQHYENEKRALLLFLQKNPDEYEIQFKEEQLSPLPSFPQIEIENTRIIKIKDKQIIEQELKLKTGKTKLFPSIQFAGKGGLIPGSTSPKNLSFSSKSSFYELGVSLNWIMFSKSFYEKVNQEKYMLEESKIDMEILKQELKNKINTLEKEILISYNNVHRARKSNSYQKKAFKELKKSFEQGRVDIFELINTESKLRESEVRKKAALSEYSLFTLQLLALRDQLVENYLKP